MWPHTWTESDSDGLHSVSDTSSEPESPTGSFRVSTICTSSRKQGIFISENYIIKTNNTPTAGTADHSATVNSWLCSVSEIVQQNVPRWQNQIDGYSMKHSMQPQPEFKSFTVHIYMICAVHTRTLAPELHSAVGRTASLEGTNLVWAWAWASKC